MVNVKADLHSHPHFYSPNDSFRESPPSIDERAYTLLSPVPSLIEIVNNSFKKGIHISAVTACHSPTGGIDNRIYSYASQLASLEKDFNLDFSCQNSLLRVVRKSPREEEPVQIILIPGQQVRAKYTDSSGRESYADLNIIGTAETVPPLLSVEETAKIGRDKGAIVLVSRPNSSVCSLGLHRSLDLVYADKVDGLEGFDASEPKESNDSLGVYLKAIGRKYPAVSNSHHFSEIGTAYSIFDEAVMCNPIEGIRRALRTKKFENHEGYLSPLSIHLCRNLPIAMSIPVHSISGRFSRLRTSLRRNQ